MQIAQVNLPVAKLIWLMIIPMLVKIDLRKMKDVAEHSKGIVVTLSINWLVKPFSMALLAWIFIRHFFAPYLPAEQIDSYIAGLILLAAAPCTALVFVWSNLCDGDAKFTLSQVAVNDVIMLFAFQGQQILAQPLIILLLAVPILILVHFNAGLAYWLNKKFEVAHCVAGPSSLIGASNFFELAVATAIALFGFNSGAALATVVGALIEVPVMLSVVAIVKKSRAWYEQ